MTAKKVKIGDQPFMMIPLRPNMTITVTTWLEGGALKTSIREYESTAAQEPMAYGKLKLVPESRLANWGSSSCSLPEATFKFVEYACKHQGQLLTYEKLADICGVSNCRGSVSQVINRLKHCLRGEIWRCIRNVRGKGYIFVLPESEDKT